MDFPPVPSNERKCTDVAFLLIFFFYWIGIIVVAVVAYDAGNPARLVYGSDYQGNICGDEKGAKGSAPFVVFPRAEQDIDQNQLYLATSSVLGFDFDVFDVDFFSICQESCPKAGDFVCTYEAEDDIAANLAARSPETREDIIRGCLNNPLLNTYGLASACQSELIQKGCWEQFFDNTAVLFRCFPEFEYSVELLADESECLEARNYTVGSSIRTVCVKFKEVTKVTKVEPLDSNPLFDTFNSVNRVFETLYGDVIKAQNVILGCGLGIALITGLFYIGSLWCCVGVVVWLSIVACLSLLIAFTIYCYFKAGILNEDVISDVSNAVDAFIAGTTSVLNLPGFSPGSSGNNTVVDSGTELPLALGISLEYREEFEYGAYILTVFTSLLLLLVLGLASRINKAIQIFAEASRCVRNNLSLLVVPPIGVAFLMSIVLFWIITAAHVSTMGTVSNFTLPLGLSSQLNLTEFDFNNKVFGPFTYTTVFNVFLLFGALWSMSFTSGVAHMTMAHVVAKWYWSGSPSDYRTAGRWALCSSVKTVFTKHLGSAAFGSLLISLIQLVRYIAAFIQHRFNKVQSQNRILRYLFMSLNCCLKCAETCVKFISKHAYVMTAMYGTSFCTSTKMVFSVS